MTLIKKLQWGGPSPFLGQLATKSTEEVKDDFKKTEPLQYAIPIWGTALTYRDLIKDPSWKNAGWAALSTAGDAASIFGVGEVINAFVAKQKAAKALNAALKTYEAAHATGTAAAKTATTAAKNANRANAISRLKPESAYAAMEAFIAEREAAKATLEFLAAQQALNGYGVGTKSTRLAGNTGVMRHPSLVAGKGENVVGTWKLGAEGVLDAAQNMHGQAAQNLRSSAIKAPFWQLLNLQTKVPIVVGKQTYDDGTIMLPEVTVTPTNVYFEHGYKPESTPNYFDYFIYK